MSQFQYRNKNQNFISNFVFQFIKKTKWHFGYTDQGAPDNIPEIASKGALQDLYKDAPKGTPEVALKGALHVAVELQLFMLSSMHKSVQNDSIQCEIESALFVALEGASKISFQGELKTT